MKRLWYILAAIALWGCSSPEYHPNWGAGGIDIPTTVWRSAFKHGVATKKVEIPAQTSTQYQVGYHIRNWDQLQDDCVVITKRKGKTSLTLEVQSKTPQRIDIMVSIDYDDQ